MIEITGICPRRLLIAQRCHQIRIERHDSPFCKLPLQAAVGPRESVAQSGSGILKRLHRVQDSLDHRFVA